MNVGLRHLNAFVAVSDLGSFSAAANRLCVVPSALTVIIKQLESECGLELFERSTRKVRLTDAGKLLLPKARSLIADFSSAFDGVGAYASLAKGLVTIAAFASVIAAYLPRPMRSFRDDYPGIDISIRDEGADEIVRLVHENVADIGVTSLPAGPVSDLACHLCCTDTFGILCRADHPLARRRDRPAWSDLAGHPFIRLSAGTGIQSLLSTEFESIVRPPPSNLEVSSITALQALVAAGFGISVLPRLATLPYKSEDLRFLLPREPTISRKIYIINRKGRTLPPAAARFLEYLRRPQSAPDASA